MVTAKNENKLGQYIPLHYHYQMLVDNNRMMNFRQAISMKVKPGDMVVDLGSGTGALSFFAAREGASVIGIENNRVLVDYSEQRMLANGISSKVKLLHQDAMLWTPNVPVDIVVCEMLHSGLLREKQIQVINSFRRNHLKKFGRIPQFIPYATLLAVQPIHMDYDFEGFYAPIPLFQDPYTVQSSQTIFNPLVYKTVVYEDEEEGSIEANLTFTAEEGTTINALRFVTKSILAMDLLTKDSVEWFNQYLVLPLGSTLNIDAGESFSVQFKYHSGDEIEVLQASLIVRPVENSSL